MNDVVLPATGAVVETVDQGGTGTTNATTASGNATLNFAATPAFVSVGMGISDTTAPSVIPSGTTVLSFTGTTVVMSANATGSGVGSGDSIAFTAQRQVVSVGPSTTDVAVVPAVTASAYTAGNVLGGIMTFAGLLAPVAFNGILQSITAKFKASAATGNLEVAIFKASPSNGTYTDKAAPTWNAADMANLVGIYTLVNPNSKLGAMAIYNLDGIGKALVGASQSLFAVVIVDGTPTPASTSDFTLELSVLPG
jgi:hypothetical protein